MGGARRPEAGVLPLPVAGEAGRGSVSIWTGGANKVCEGFVPNEYGGCGWDAEVGEDSIIPESSEPNLERKVFFSSSGAGTKDRGQGSAVFSRGERVLTFTAVGFLLLLRVLATPTDTPPFLVLVGLGLEEVFDGFGPDGVLLVLGLGLQDVRGRLWFEDILRSLGFERIGRGFGFESVTGVPLARTPGDSIKTETRLLPLDEDNFLEVGVFSVVDVDFVTIPASGRGSSNTPNDI